MGETPVTQRQFAVWTQMEAIKHRNSFQNMDNHPAEDLVWDDAVAFGQWLTVRLPDWRQPA